jgi:hypothetical protein
MLFLPMVEAKRRVIVLNEQDMCHQCKKEVAGGRVPPEIGFVCVIIPDELRARLVEARPKASIAEIRVRYRFASSSLRLHS